MNYSLLFQAFIFCFLSFGLCFLLMKFGPKTKHPITIIREKRERITELEQALHFIKQNDKTRSYEYKGKAAENRNGELPENGKRWLTPYEIAENALRQAK